MLCDKIGQNMVLNIFDYDALKKLQLRSLKMKEEFILASSALAIENDDIWKDKWIHHEFLEMQQYNFKV